jgi:hypothetical protein
MEKKKEDLTMHCTCIAKVPTMSNTFTIGKVYKLIPDSQDIYAIVNDNNIVTYLNSDTINDYFSSIVYNDVIYMDVRDCYKQMLEDNSNGDDFVKNEDKINHPSHYTWLKEKCGIEVIDITRHMDFDLGNAIKYILRNGHKSEEGYSDKEKAIEDLKKAMWYLDDKIKMLENGN